MKKFALAAAAAAALMFTAPSFTGLSASPAEAQTTVVKKKVVIKRGDGDGMRRKVVIRHHGDRGRHNGWRHRNSGMNKTVVIKRGGGDGMRSRTVIKRKTVIN